MYRNLCRLCANEIMDGSALQLFERRHRILLTQLKQITGVMLKSTDGLPRLICSRCVESLKDAHQFREIVLRAQISLKTKLSLDNKKIQQGETLIHATEFVQVCYLRDEKDQTIASINNVDEKEINISDSQTKKTEGSCASEVNALEISSNEDNALEEVRISDRNENKEHSPTFTVNYSSNDDAEHFSQFSSAINEPEEVYGARNLSQKEIRRPRDTHNKVKTKNQNLTEQATKTDGNSKGKKTRKKRKDTEDHPHIFICDQCGNHFTCRHHFKLHLRRHTGDKQCACELCPDKFFTSSELRRHMRKHTGERPFACKYCKRRFTDYSTRIKHERTHTNERPFMCTQCGKSFTTSYILKNHMLTHTGERHFKCDVCNKAFTRRTHLVVHFRSVMHKQAVDKEKHVNPQELQTRRTAPTNVPTFLV